MLAAAVDLAVAREAAVLAAAADVHPLKKRPSRTSR